MLTQTRSAGGIEVPDNSSDRAIEVEFPLDFDVFGLQTIEVPKRTSMARLPEYHPDPCHRSRVPLDFDVFLRLSDLSPIT